MISHIIQTSLLLWTTFATLFAVLWWFLKDQRKYELVDTFWSWCLGLSALFIAVLSSGLIERRWLLAIITLCWSSRLGIFLFWGRFKNGISDGRYENWLKELGENATSKVFWFFQAQAFSIVLLSLPFIAVAFNKNHLTISDGIAAVVFMIALFGEWQSDRTLNQFRLKPENKGKVCQEGLWAYSRHPNYFFEWLHWFTYVFLCFGTFPNWILALFGPIAMFWLLTRITGIPLTEAQSLRSRGDAYKRYQQTTSSFIPWFPKKGFS